MCYSHLEVVFSLVFGSLSWCVDFSFSSSWFPVNSWVYILNIVSLMILLHPSTGVNQKALVEWFILIISVSVLCSNNVSVSIFLGLPWGLIEELGVGLESTCNSAWSFGFLQGVVEFNLLHWQLSVSIWLGSIVWLQVSLSESGAPFLVEGFMIGKFRGGTVASEEIGAGFIEGFLINHET